MDEVCGDETVLIYPGRIIGNVGMQSDLACQKPPNHQGGHQVERWCGNVLLIARWS